jgi:predicted secreted protein
MSGISAFGTLLQRGDASTGTAGEGFTTLANVTNISGPKLKAEQIDVSSHDSVDGYEEFVAGIKRGGEISLDINYDPSNATHETLLDDFDDGALHNYQLIFPTNPATTWSFAAIVTEVGPEAPYDDKLTCSATLKLSGKVTRAEPAT